MKRRVLATGVHVEDRTGTELVVLSSARWKKHPYIGYGKPSLVPLDGRVYAVHGDINPKGRSMAVAVPDGAASLVSPDDLYPVGTYMAYKAQLAHDAAAERALQRAYALEEADALRQTIHAYWGGASGDVLARVGDTGDCPPTVVLLNMRLAADLGRIRYAYERCEAA